MTSLSRDRWRLPRGVMIVSRSGHDWRISRLHRRRLIRHFSPQPTRQGSRNRSGTLSAGAMTFASTTPKSDHPVPQIAEQGDGTGSGILGKPAKPSEKMLCRPLWSQPGRQGCGHDGQDTYYVGTMKGVGLFYQQTFIDTYARVATAKLYTEKIAITAADLLNDRVIPFFAEHGISLLRILTDRGTEYCGKVENHAYQLYLAVEDVDHTRTKANSPQTNGICERFHRTIKDEFYDIAFRKKLYRSVEELQTDLDVWLVKYNEQRPCCNQVELSAVVQSRSVTHGGSGAWLGRAETSHIDVDKTIRASDPSDSQQAILSAVR